MSVKCGDIANFIEGFASLELAEDWDNVGLLLGSAKKDVSRIILCLDVTSEVVDESIRCNADMILSHHPLIFKALKKLNEDSPKGQVISRIIRNRICVYSAHTNLDAAYGGVNDRLAHVLGLEEVRNLKNIRYEKLLKLAVFVPEDYAENIRDAMSKVGAGWIGNYSDCFFMAKGTGTFKPLDNTNPFIGSRGKLEKVNEIKLETVVHEKNLDQVVEAMKKAHPYEEVAYDIYLLDVKGQEFSYGKWGFLKEPMELDGFVSLVKDRLGAGSVRVIGSTGRKVSKVAVYSGSFDDDFSPVIKEKVDVLVTGDIKYHTAVDLIEAGLCVIDAGHFNTERIVLPFLAKTIKDRFQGIEVIASSVEIDPFKFS